MNTFETILTTNPFNIDSCNIEKFILESQTRFASIKVYLKERPKIVLPNNDLKRMVLCKINKQITYDNAVDFIKSKNGIFPNFEGLTVSKVFLQNILTNKHSHVYGFDIRKNLWEPYENEVLFIPWIGQKHFGLASFGTTNGLPYITDKTYLMYLI